MAEALTLRDYRIGEGSLLRRFEKRACLTSLRRQLAIAVAVTWVPLMVFGLLDERLTGRPEPLLHSAAMHVRLLVAAPMLLVLDQVFPWMCKLTLEQLVAQAIIPPRSQPRFDRLLRSAARLADAALPELLLALLGLSLGVAALLGVMPVSGLARRSGGLAAAQMWYALSDWPFFQFLLWRSLWRWAIWVRILIGLSRMDLALVATHPDRRAGIGFLRLPSIGYCAGLLFTGTSVMCAEWSWKFTDGASLAAFKPLLLAFAIIGTTVALGPLLFFVPMLVRTRQAGWIGYGGLATTLGRRFRRRWIEHRTGLPDQDETQPVADLGTIYRDAVDRMQFLMVDTRDLIWLLVATLLPVVPVMVAKIPGEDWRELLGLVTGRRL